MGKGEGKEGWEKKRRLEREEREMGMKKVGQFKEEKLGNLRGSKKLRKILGVRWGG